MWLKSITVIHDHLCYMAKWSQWYHDSFNFAQVIPGHKIPVPRLIMYEARGKVSNLHLGAAGRPWTHHDFTQWLMAGLILVIFKKCCCWYSIIISDISSISMETPYFDDFPSLRLRRPTLGPQATSSLLVPSFVMSTVLAPGKATQKLEELENFQWKIWCEIGMIWDLSIKNWDSMELFNKKLDEMSFDCQILGNIGI